MSENKGCAKESSILPRPREKGCRVRPCALLLSPPGLFAGIPDFVCSRLKSRQHALSCLVPFSLLSPLFNQCAVHMRRGRQVDVGKTIAEIGAYHGGIFFELQEGIKFVSIDIFCEWLCNCVKLQNKSESPI